MKVALSHNIYQIAGGEDAVFDNEAELLSGNGHVVVRHCTSNKLIVSLMQKVLATLQTPFSLFGYRATLKFLSDKQPDVMHVHNYFPLFSPSIFYACKSVNVPVIHTLHNYRAICPTALLMHGGNIEERSIHGTSWWSVVAKVYRNSFVGSFVLACMVELHKRLGTWQTKVDRYIALTEFAKRKYVEAGWPEHKICVKPNFIDDPYDGATSVAKSGGYALFVGRLSEEKGVELLLKAWSDIGLQLKVIGDGPLKTKVERDASGIIKYLGLKKKADVLNLIQHADFVIMPSTWYEGFPMVLVEAFACGTPALVSRLGSMEEIVGDGVTGLHFEAGNEEDLALKVQWLINNPESAREMGQNARNEYLSKYTPEKNYETLINIYQQAIEEAQKH